MERLSITVAVGIGCRKSCSAGVVESLVRQTLEEVPSTTPLGLFTVIDKQGEEGLAEAASHLGLTVTYLSRAALLERKGDVMTPSPASESRFGTPSVAEAAALVGAGPGSILIVSRVASGGATCAIARAGP